MLSHWSSTPVHLQVQLRDFCTTSFWRNFVPLPEERNSPTRPVSTNLHMPLHIPLSSISRLLHLYSNDKSWLKLWDMALERGVFATTWIQATLRFLSLHTHSGGTCPAPNCTSTLVPSLPVDTLCRPTLVLIDNFIHACTNFSVSLFSYGHGLHSCFKSLWNHLFFFHLHLTAFSDSSCKIRVMIFWTTKLPIPVFIVFCEIPANRGR